MVHKILVTGGAGYLGSILVPELLGQGHEVMVLDTFLFGQSSLLECCANDRFSVVRGDAREESVLRPLLKQADLIIPLAALVGAPLCSRDAVGTVTTNRDAVITLARLASSDQGILYPCTNSGYGIGTHGVPCTEDTPLKPLSLYGRAKVEAEQALLDRGNAVSLRLATVFGMAPRMRIDLLVNDFTYRAVKDRSIVVFEGSFKRNYIHIRDVARSFLHGIERFGTMKGRPYNVGMSDANLSKLELCEKIREQVPGLVILEAPVGEDPDKRDYIVSNERIEGTGFKPAFSLEQGIRELIKGYTIITNSIYGNV